MSATVVSADPAAAVAGTQAKMDAVQSFIWHHILDSSRWRLFGHDVSLPGFLTVHGVMVIFCALLVILLFGMLYRKSAPVPSGFTNLLELFVIFIRDHISAPFLGKEMGEKMTPLFCNFFFFILVMNLVGLVPCFYAATANVNVTGALALVSFSFMIFGAMYANGPRKFFKGFLIPGVPWPILLVLVPVELVSILIRTFALAVRLFANELAGHMIVFSLVGLVVIFGYFGLPSLILAVGADIFEVFVALLQAYIFTLLSAIFIGERYHPAH